MRLAQLGADVPSRAGWYRFLARMRRADAERRIEKIAQSVAEAEKVADRHGIKAAGRAHFAGGLRDTQLPTGESKRPLFMRYGGTLGGFVDLYRHRVIGLQATVDFVDPLGDDAIVPFTELVDLGGARPLRGFWWRRHVDRSAATATLEYRWPIWVWLDGSLHYALGNVFGEHLKGFDLELLRQSFGIGFKANAAEDHTFELLVGGGSATFADGGEIESFRFVFGSTAGF